MPKKARELSALEVMRLKHSGIRGVAAFAVGGVAGLQIEIAPTGARSWVLRQTIGGKRRKVGLGGYPEVSLAQARERARQASDMVRMGIDPIEERKAKASELAAARRRSITFADAVEKLLERKAPEFKSNRHGKLWRSSLDLYVLPKLGNRLVADIGRQDILRALEPIWFDKTDTAKKG